MIAVISQRLNFPVLINVFTDSFLTRGVLSQDLARRLRSLEILEDLQTLSNLGMPVDVAAGENRRLMLETYRHHARVGEFDHLRQFIDPQAISIDVGANVGQYALKLAAESHKCLVIEPIHDLTWLEEVLPPNCQFFSAAAGAEDGVGTLTIPIEEGQPRYPLATLGDFYDAGEIMQQETAVRSLDSILDECCPDERVGFIKIDVEGMESAVIEGARRTLDRWQPNLQIEIWRDSVLQMKSTLAELGYRGLFFFNSRLFDINQYDPAVHNAPENAWRAEAPEAYDPNLYVNNFFFIPT
jgi:FkbM family methyltransferase